MLRSVPDYRVPPFDNALLILQHFQDSIKRDDRKVNASEAKAASRTTTFKMTVPKIDSQFRGKNF